MRLHVNTKQQMYCITINDLVALCSYAHVLSTIGKALSVANASLAVLKVVDLHVPAIPNI